MSYYIFISQTDSA